MSTVARSVREIIEDFLSAGPYAVVGASNDRAKFGNKVLRAYKSKGWKVSPVNPRENEVEGLQAYPDLASLPEKPRGVSIITPPQVTERVVAEAADAGARFVWDGSCFLVETRFRG